MITLRATTGSPLLQAFHDAGVLGLADVHAARRWAALCGEADERVLLAAALCVQALRSGSVSVDLDRVHDTAFQLEETATVDASELPWPELGGWHEAVASSPMVTRGDAGAGVRPLRLADGLLYLERYWGHQESVRAALLGRRDAPVPADLERLRASLDELFDGRELDATEPDLQRRSVATAVCARVCVVAGGPGTGKTTTVARLLTTLWDQDPDLRIALCAPTGKAAARMEESLRQQEGSLPERVRERMATVTASTMHRLLGWVPDNSTRFRHDASNPLAHDVVIVDEVSMVALAMMARLVEALPATARLVLVGDPDQLTSVEAGAVLADIVAADMPPLPELAAQLRAVDADGWARRGLPEPAEKPATGVVRLQHSYRFDGDIARLAAAVRDGDAEAALEVLTRGGDARLVTDPLEQPATLAELRRRVVSSGRASIDAARRGDAHEALAALDSHRLLCAHRSGPYGVAHWSRQAERWLLEADPDVGGGDFYVGRPLIVGANLPISPPLFNGDTGVVVRTPAGPRAAFARGGGQVVDHSLATLSDVTSLWAMTVHKSQGSQFRHVSLVLPPADSPLLMRELFYTAVTRASHGVTIYGAPEAVRVAIGRSARRASGLAERLSAAARARGTSAG